MKQPSVNHKFVEHISRMHLRPSICTRYRISLSLDPPIVHPLTALSETITFDLRESPWCIPCQPDVSLLDFVSV